MKPSLVKRLALPVGIFALLASCGIGPTEKEYVPVERSSGGSSGGSNGGSSGGVATYAEVNKILEDSCGNAGCHAGAGFLKSESNLVGNSQVKNRIINGSMPPRYASNYNLWEDGTKKAKVLEFLGSR